jgi:uncharacterized protein
MVRKAFLFIKNIPCSIVIFLIHFYRYAISPQFPGCCRFRPTCSEYAIEALKKYGFFKGVILTIKRLIRCRPGGGHGYDPVP